VLKPPPPIDTVPYEPLASGEPDTWNLETGVGVPIPKFPFVWNLPLSTFPVLNKI
jgi:hypothetical protein